MKYALDADHNLVPGDDLTFAYQGSGVATFIDKDGTGFRVPIGTRNLAGVSADGTVYLEDEGKPEPLTAGSIARVMASVEGIVPDIVIVDLTTLDKPALRDLCKRRGIKLRGNPSEATLIGLLEDAD